MCVAVREEEGRQKIHGNQGWCIDPEINAAYRAILPGAIFDVLKRFLHCLGRTVLFWKGIILVVPNKDLGITYFKKKYSSYGTALLMSSIFFFSQRKWCLMWRWG